MIIKFIKKMAKKKKRQKIQEIIDKVRNSKKNRQMLAALKQYKKQGYDTLYVPVSGIGDGVVFSAVAKMIYEKNGKKVLVSHKNNELFKNNPYIETIDGIYDTLINKSIEKKIKELGVDIVYPTYWNFTEQGDKLKLAYPKRHIIAAIAEKTGFTGNIELKPEIFLTDEEKRFGRFSDNKPQIVIMSTAIDVHKQWDKWQELVDELKDTYYFVQLGASQDTKLEGVDDKRGVYTLRECASVIYNSDLFVGQIGGLMHMARAVDCPAVIAYSLAEPVYFDSYISNSNIFPKKMCNICTQDGTSAYSEQCNNDYCCIKSIEVCDMVSAIKSKLAKPKQTLEFDTVNINNSNNVHLEDYYKRYSPKLFIA